MRAMRFDALGGPEHVRVHDVTLPAPAPDQVRYRVHAFALNQADLLAMEGRHYTVATLPSGFGYEASGVVEEVGSAVTRFRRGDRISVLPCAEGHYFAAAEQALIPEAFAAPWTEGYTAEAAASVWMQYLTGYFPICELGAAGPGDFVLVVAASSSAGLAAMSLTRMRGAIPIATSRTHDKTEFLLANGAEAVIATESEDLAARIRECTGGKGVRIVYDAIAGSFVQRYEEALARDARIYLYGGLSGEMEVRFNILPIVRSAASVTGYSLINHTLDRTQLVRARDFITDALARGALPAPIVDRVFDFDDTVAALDYMKSGRQRGKIVVRVV